MYFNLLNYNDGDESQCCQINDKKYLINTYYKHHTARQKIQYNINYEVQTN